MYRLECIAASRREEMSMRSWCGFLRMTVGALGAKKVCASRRSLRQSIGVRATTGAFTCLLLMDDWRSSRLVIDNPAWLERRQTSSGPVMHNLSLDSDPQLQDAASPQVLWAGQLRRCVALASHA